MNHMQEIPAGAQPSPDTTAFHEPLFGKAGLKVQAPGPRPGTFRCSERGSDSEFHFPSQRRMSPERSVISACGYWL